MNNLDTFFVVYVYRNEEGKILQRTFSIAEIKRGEDDAHLAIMPGYKLIDIRVKD